MLINRLYANEICVTSSSIDVPFHIRLVGGAFDRIRRSDRVANNALITDCN